MTWTFAEEDPTVAIAAKLKGAPENQVESVSESQYDHMYEETQGDL